MVHCREAANTARLLLFMVRTSLGELSKTAFIPVQCAKVRPHQEYAMEANAQTLSADINQLERIQHLATLRAHTYRLLQGAAHFLFVS